MMPEQQRQALIIQCEGNCLSHVGNGFGTDHAADIARAVIDGWMNGLVRMEGEEAAARYACALADRVVNRAIKVTAYTAPAALMPPIPPVPPPTKPPMGWRRLAREVLLPWALGWAAGFICGLMASGHR